MSNAIYATAQTFTNGEIAKLSHTFSGADAVIVSITSPQARDTWHKAGHIVQSIYVDGIGWTEVSNSISYVGFAPTLFRFPDVGGYRIRFKPVPWLTQFTVTAWIWN